MTHRMLLMLTCLAVIPCCGQKDSPSSQNARSADGGQVDEADLGTALKHLRSLPYPRAVLDAGDRNQVVVELAAWANSPERLNSLLLVSSSRDPLRRTAAALAGTAEPEKSASFAMEAVRGVSFDGDPYVMGYLIFWGSSSLRQALSRAGELLRERGWHPRIAGHVTAVLASLQTRPPSVIAVSDPLKEPSRVPSYEDWQVVIDHESLEDVFVETLLWNVRFAKVADPKDLESGFHYPTALKGKLSFLLHNAAGHPKAFSLPNSEDREPLRDWLREWRSPPSWEAIRSIHPISILSDYVDGLWPPRDP